MRTTSGAAAPEIQVTTAPVTRGDIIDTVGATGTLQAVTTVQVGSQVSGNISWLGADFNSIVKKGQVIARLDPSMLDAQLQQARANLAQARANLSKAQSDLDRTRVQLVDAQQKYTRAKELAARSLLPQSELDAAKVAVDTAQAGVASQQATVAQTQAGVAQSQASVNQNQVNLDHTVIAAPIDGIVTQRSVDVGQTVAASMQAPTLFVIAADLTKMQVNANIDEADVGRIRPGQHVTFHVDAYPTETFDGTVVAGSPAAGRRAERDDLRHGHRRAEPGAEAEAGNDREREGRDREAHERVARAERRAAFPPHARGVRRAQSAGARSAVRGGCARPRRPARAGGRPADAAEPGRGAAPRRQALRPPRVARRVRSGGGDGRPRWRPRRTVPAAGGGSAAERVNATPRARWNASRRCRPRNSSSSSRA